MASQDTLPECVRACWELLHSEAFFLLLSNFTGLRLHYLCPADDDDDENNEEEKEKKEKEDPQDGKATGSSSGPSSASASKEKGVHHCELFYLVRVVFVYFDTL